MDSPRAQVGEQRDLLLAAIEAIAPGREGLRDFYTEDLVLATGLPAGEVASLLPGLVAGYRVRVAATAAGRVV